MAAGQRGKPVKTVSTKGAGKVVKKPGEQTRSAPRSGSADKRSAVVNEGSVATKGKGKESEAGAGGGATAATMVTERVGSNLATQATESGVAVVAPAQKPPEPQRIPPPLPTPIATFNL